MARSVYARALVGVSLIVSVGACASSATGAGPTATPAAASPSIAAAAATPSPSQSVTPEPGYGSAPPDWPTPPPFAPASPLPDPSGDPIPATMVGREYNVDPPETMRTQALVLTLRAIDDPHCVALFDGRSTCFTILWTPNYPKKNDPAVRGSARIVDGNLSLSFDYVPFDEACQGTTSTYAMSPDGWTLTGKDVPGCSFQGFTQH
jgi:hypothetical protein